MNIASIVKNKESILENCFLDNLMNADINNRFGITVHGNDLKDWLFEKYCRPLYRLLIESFDSEKIKQIYFDERLRYAPHRSPFDVRAAFHREVLTREANVIFADVPHDQQERLFEEWFDFHKQLLNINNNDSLTVLAIGDCLLNEVRVFINASTDAADPFIDMRCIYFNAGSDGGFDIGQVENYLKSNKVDVITLSFFSFDAMPGFRRHFESGDLKDYQTACDQYIGMCEVFLEQLGRSYQGMLLIHNVCGLPLGRWRKRLPFLSPFNVAQKKLLEYLNVRINEMVAAQKNAMLIDENNIVKTLGLRNLSKPVVSQRAYGGLFHTSELGVVLAKEYIDFFRVFSKLRNTKALLLDFDNTLWEGVMAEGEVKHYSDRQKLLSEIQAGGVVLAAVSKNTPENIRWDEMTLARSAFVAEKISWSTKVDSIKELAQELNLGLNSFVFIDDNHHERAMVNNELPQVVCLDATLESTWRSVKLMLSMPITTKTEEAAKRTEMYRQQAERRKIMVSGQDKALMYERLGLKYSIFLNDASLLDRIAELVERTNQFNTTTRRYSRTQIQEKINSDQWLVAAFSMGDEYGDLGVVGVVFVEFTNDRTAIIDSFIMSCRAMGFGLEQQMLHEIVKLVEGKNFNKLIGLFFSSDRNSPCSGLYQSVGFSLQEGGSWELSGSSFDSVKTIAWLKKQ